MISALRGRCPGPLDECGLAGLDGDPVATDRDDTNERAAPPLVAVAGGLGRCLKTRSESVRLQESADRLRDLLVAALADDEPVV